MKRTLALTAAAALLLPVATDEPERPLCHLNDGGTWTYVADHYDDARDGGHIADRMPNADGTCTWPVVAPAPTPQVRTVVREVVRVKAVTRRCVVVRRAGAIDKRRCAVTVRWSS